ncbi:hypothetical protein [Cryptosporangium minutisporangium]|uniref:hypothetical protein n=1 Tax=Cryptosporangium minutisporangium TaxID=113569 RepID=UPI0031EA4767
MDRYRGHLPGRLTAVDTSAEQPCFEHDLRFEADSISHRLSSRRSDVSRKRNLALLLARASGVRRLLFLDDDVAVPDRGDVRRATGGLDQGFTTVGLPVGQFPDHSVVCHAHRLAGGAQDGFIGAGALLVDPQRITSFFPDIYNEDWLFILDEVAAGAVATVGRAV